MLQLVTIYVSVYVNCSNRYARMPRKASSLTLVSSRTKKHEYKFYVYEYLSLNREEEGLFCT